jgi:energy-coupling factor transporter ATP-binding protein EcfA2
MQVANPFSTGGGGPAFEFSVGATYLVSLLAEDVPRGLNAGTAKEIRFQAHQQGVPLDDILVTSDDGELERRLALQVRHRVVFSAQDAKFRELISAAWSTYSGSEGWTFDAEHDRLGIAIGTITGAISEHAMTLVRWARACLTAQEFFDKVGTSGFSSIEKQDYLAAFQSTLDAAARRRLSDDKVWGFLKCLVILYFDLENEESHEATVAWNRLQDLLPQRDTHQARLAFGVLKSIVAELSPVSGTMDTAALRSRLQGEGLSLVTPLSIRSDLRRIDEHSQRVLKGIRLDLADVIHLTRQDVAQNISQAMDAASLIVIMGEPGSGKSVVLRSLAERLMEEGQVVLSRADEFGFPMLEGFTSSLGVKSTVGNLITAMSSAPNRCLLIDGLERILRLSNTAALNDLIAEIARINKDRAHQGNPDRYQWKVVCTCRSTELRSVLDILSAMDELGKAGGIGVVEVPSLSDPEIEEIKRAVPLVGPLLKEAHLQDLLRRPLYLDICARKNLLDQPDGPRVVTEAWFAEQFWRKVVRASERTSPGAGNPMAREQTLLKVAKQKLETGRTWVPANDLDSEALTGLISDRVLRFEDDSVDFAHDVFEDWAVFKLLWQAQEHVPAFIQRFYESRGIDRPLRLFACRVVEGSVPEWVKLIELLSSSPGLSPRWRDICLTAPLFSPLALEILRGMESALVANGGQLLGDMLSALPDLAMVSASSSGLGIRDEQMEQFLAAQLRRPLPHVWSPILPFLLQLGIHIPDGALLGASKVIRAWIQRTRLGSQFRRELGLLARDLLLAHKHSRLRPNDNGPEIRESLFLAIFSGSDCLAEEVEKLVRQWMAGDVDGLGQLFYWLEDNALSNEAIASLGMHLPQLLADVSRHCLLEERSDDEWDSLGDLGIAEPAHWYPPTAYKGPFFTLLAQSEHTGLDLLLDLTNHATNAWIRRERSGQIDPTRTKPLPQKLVLESGTREIWGGAHVWSWYRLPSVAPGPITCALMALEYHLSQAIESGRDPKPFFNYLMSRTNSASIIGVLTSAAMRWPEECAEAVLPILCCPGFWIMDSHRHQEDQMAHIAADAFGISGGVLDHRWLKRQSQEPHRRWNCEILAQWLMMNRPECRRVLLPVVREFTKNLPYTDESEISDANAEQDLRERCEFMILRTDVDNLEAVNLPNGTVRFRPKSVPPHLLERQQQTLKRTRDATAAASLIRFSNGLMNGTLQATADILEFIVKQARELEAEKAPTSSDIYQVRENEDAVALAATALLVRGLQWIQDHGHLQWCCECLLWVARRETSSAYLEADTGHRWEARRSAAIGIPILLRVLPNDAELRGALLRLLFHEMRGVREYAAKSTGDHLWPVLPDFVWACLNLTRELAIRLRNKKAGERPSQEGAWLETRLEEVNAGCYSQEAVSIANKRLEEIDLFEVQCALALLPHRFDLAPEGYRASILGLLKDWLRFTLSLHHHLAEQKKRGHDQALQVGDWDHSFFRYLAWQTILIPNEDTYRDFIAPILEIWEQAPEMMEEFLRQLLQAGTSNIAPTQWFISVWKRIGHHMLASGLTDSFLDWSHRGIRESFGLLILYDGRGIMSWKADASPPVLDLVDLFEQWCVQLGDRPLYFGILIRSLSSIAFPLFVSHGVRWLDSCIDRSGDPEAMLVKVPNAQILSELLYGGYLEESSALARDKDVWRAFNTLVDHAAKAGAPLAIALREKLQ